MQITSALHRALEQNPDRPLTIHGARVRTVAQSADRVARFAGVLQDLGVRTGDRVGVLSLNSDRYFEALLAVPWAGAAVNLVNVRWSASEIAYSMRDCDTQVLMVDDQFLPLLPALREQWEGLRTVIYSGDGDVPEGAVGLEALIADASPVPDEERQGDDLFGVFYTGGTTGFPKGVMLSHTNLLTSAEGAQASVPFIEPGCTHLHAAPMFHVAGLLQWVRGIVAGTTHAFVPTFEPRAVLEAFQTYQAEAAVLVPTMIQMLVDAPEAATADLTGVRQILYGASPISEAVLERARKTFPAAGFIQAYGMTELSPILTLMSPADHDDPSLIRSAGRVASHAEVRVVDANDVDVPTGEVGEVIARGANVMRGYWNRPEETAEALRNGWMHTGDAGYLDDRGYLFIVDRLKDMIITGGENVYSAEVENALGKHPAVATCAIIGIPDTDFGERVHAVVVLHPGAAPSPQELTDFCRTQLANYKVPRSFAFVDALPVSAAGKVLKRELRAQHWGDSVRNVS